MPQTSSWQGIDLLPYEATLAPGMYFSAPRPGATNEGALQLRSAAGGSDWLVYQFISAAQFHLYFADLENEPSFKMAVTAARPKATVLPTQQTGGTMVTAPYRTGGGGAVVQALNVSPSLGFNPGGGMTPGGGGFNPYSPSLPPGLGQLGTTLCNNIGNATLRALCLAGVSIGTGGGGTPSTDRGGGFANTPVGGSCPTGYTRNPQTGTCETAGLGGSIQRGLPGGATGTMADATGQAVMGAFNIPAEVPMQVGSVTRNDGVVSPILRCRGGMKLGADNLCYIKGTRGVRWKYATKRSGITIGGRRITQKDVKALQALTRVQHAAKAFAGASGFTCKKR